MTFARDALSGCQVLLAEREDFLGSYVAGAIRAAGGAVLGPIDDEAEVRAAFVTRADDFDAAMLNVTFAHTLDANLAQTLLGRGVALILVSASHLTVVPGHLGDRPLLTKPFSSHRVVELLQVELRERPVRTRPVG